MGRVALVATLAPGAEARARELIERGSPLDLAEAGLDRHLVFLSAGEVVFVFEGDEVEWILEDLVDEAGPVREAFLEWRDLVEGQPRIARPVFAWERDQ